MARTWAITGPAKTALTNGVGEAAFTVTSQTATPMRGLIRIIPEGNATQEMFKVVGESTLDWGANETKQVTVQIDSKGAAVGSYVYSFAVVSETDPSELSDRISSSFDVTAAPVKKPFPVGALIGAIVAVLVIGGVIAFFLTRGGFEVPNLEGKSSQEAGELLDQEGLIVSKERTLDVDSEEAPGTVLGSEPPAGTKVDEGAEISLIVAALEVEDLSGLDALTARTQLEEFGLTVAPDVSASSDTFAEGLVAGQVPPPGPNGGDTITLTVSTGPETGAAIFLPNVVGQTLDAARALLRTADPTCEPNCVGEIYTQTIFDISVPSGTVRLQIPSSTVAFEPGNDISLQVTTVNWGWGIGDDICAFCDVVIDQ
ncbi:MAG: PASTA domain-containing protein [Actinobacteria bacterium]|nr:PASTA domain-containing protein [Actinomycetota bacterium]